MPAPQTEGEPLACGVKADRVAAHGGMAGEEPRVVSDTRSEPGGVAEGQGASAAGDETALVPSLHQAGCALLADTSLRTWAAKCFDASPPAAQARSATRCLCCSAQLSIVVSSVTGCTLNDALASAHKPNPCRCEGAETHTLLDPQQAAAGDDPARGSSATPPDAASPPRTPTRPGSRMALRRDVPRTGLSAARRMSSSAREAVIMLRSAEGHDRLLPPLSPRNEHNAFTTRLRGRPATLEWSRYHAPGQRQLRQEVRLGVAAWG